MSAVERRHMDTDTLKATPYFNDGILFDEKAVVKEFVDKLKRLGYNEMK